MADDGWDMRSNIKAKPGSQGTLFQPTKGVLNPQQRWPRGYTPERLNEVRGALAKTSISHPEHMEDEHEPGDYREMYGYRERTMRAIAKSTVPAHHLIGLREIHGEPYQDPDTGRSDQGTYWPREKTIGIDLTEAETDKTLIHEIGHHVDHFHEPGAYVEKVNEVAPQHAERDYRGLLNVSALAQARNKVEPGVGEATADNYYVEHYRTGGRKSRPTRGQGLYQEGHLSGWIDKNYPGYSDVRQHKDYANLSGLQFKQEHLEGMGARFVQAESDRKWFGK